MSDFLTDEEKAEQIKAWLKENGMSVFVGIAIAVGGLFGYRYWQDYKLQTAEEASAIYSQVQQSHDDTIYSKVAQLKTDYASTPYAALASMIVAKKYTEKGDNASAIVELQWVVEHTSEKVTLDLAKTRLARLYIAQKQFDKASSILNETFPRSYLSIIEELKGDIYFAKGEQDKAKEAYDKALSSSQGTIISFLQMKRDDLGT